MHTYNTLFSYLLFICSRRILFRICDKVTFLFWVPVTALPLILTSGFEIFELKTQLGHSSILAWRIPWTEEPGGPQSMESQRVIHD